MDIFNALGNYETGYLSVPHFGLAALSNGDSIVFFAGGINLSLNEVYDVVDIYHVNTHAWSTEHLSIPRHSMGYAVSGDRAFFAGGWNADGTEAFDRVDIYNFTSRTWDSARLSQARGFIGATIA